MEPTSLLPAIISLFIALITANFIGKLFGYATSQGRFASIDGLRGYLAFLVFIHHSCIWFFYLRSGEWNEPPSNIYNNFGQASVSLFFMITGFLFFSKLIEARYIKIDWLSLFVSRFLRLTPLYLMLIFIFFFIVYYISDGIMVDPFPKLIKDILKWLSFRIFGGPELNGVKDISNTIVGITWSLPYEWFFYFSLPLLALTVGIVPPKIYVFISFIILSGVSIFIPKFKYFIPFLSGIIASYLARITIFTNFASSRLSSLIIIFCFVFSVYYYPSSYKLEPLFLLSIGFTLIASGNSVFGILTNAASRTLGEYSYGIYLLHSVMLFIIFNFIIGLPNSVHLSPAMHWLVVLGLTPLLIIICFITFRFIERPAMLSSSKVVGWLRGKWIDK